MPFLRFHKVKQLTAKMKKKQLLGYICGFIAFVCVLMLMATFVFMAMFSGSNSGNLFLESKNQSKYWL